MAQGSNDFEALARQYWGSWSDALRGGMPQAGTDAGVQGFRDALGAWTKAAGGGQGGFDHVLDHVKRQGGDWFAQMQQVAAQFAGRQHSARDVAEAWQQMLGGNPFDGLFQGMRGPGLKGLEQWNQAAAPWLQNLRSEAASTLGMPAFGFAREHQERLQALGQAQMRWQDALSGYHALMAKTSQDAYSRFESKLAEREEPGRQLGSVRALFDLWVDAAEEAYAEVALSTDYRKAYGELVNTQMQLRATAQAIAEQAATMMGMPSRTETDSAHRKIAELERQLRRMQRKADTTQTAASPEAKTARKQASQARPAKKIARKSAQPVAKNVAKQVVKPAAKKTSVKPAARKR